MKKITYVLDTSALIFNPCCWKEFPNSEIIIPITVLKELDKLKKQIGEAGKNARICIRLLDEISDLGDISKGITLSNNIILKIDTTVYNCSDLGDSNYGDTHILACLNANHLLYLENNLESNVTLVSNDINLRVRAKSMGIKAISYTGNKNTLNELYSGYKIIVNDELGIKLADKQSINLEEYNLDLEMNEYVLFQSEHGEGLSMGRKVSNKEIRRIQKHCPWEIQSRNKEQAFAIDLIMDRNIDLVTLIGRAGTGKSLVALASALELVLNKRAYDKLVIYRPIQAVGKEIGYLPGTLQEKLAPWFQAILDSLELLFNNRSGIDWKRELEMFQKKGKIEMEAITYVRGRSIPNSIILVDEAQNITKEDIKTILTRAGENSKIILTGDLEQIDNNDLDALNNGLTHVIESFKDSTLAGHITFTQGVRSRLATLAAELL